MSNIDKDVKGAVETTGYIYQSILDLWAMTPIELKMYIAAMFIISILLQYYKKSFLTECSKKQRIQKLWAVSFPFSLVIAGIGLYVYGEKIHFGYFVLTGLTASTVSMGVHRVAVDYVWPTLKTVFGMVWARVKIILTGKAPVKTGK